jgi:drug/metabolite transporter (DMT)-like permease
LYIFPVGLAGCFLAGTINGLGSLLYYVALSELPASVGQLLYALYPIFVALFSILDKQPISRLTMLRMGLAFLAVLLLINPAGSDLALWAVLMMIGSAALYALHIPINQRVLYEIPAPTVTLYTLLAMSLVTLPAYLILDRHCPPARRSGHRSFY